MTHSTPTSPAAATYLSRTSEGVGPTWIAIYPDLVVAIDKEPGPMNETAFPDFPSLAEHFGIVDAQYEAATPSWRPRYRLVMFGQGHRVPMDGLAAFESYHRAVLHAVAIMRSETGAEFAKARAEVRVQDLDNGELVANDVHYLPWRFRDEGLSTEDRQSLRLELVADQRQAVRDALFYAHREMPNELLAVTVVDPLDELGERFLRACRAGVDALATQRKLDKAGIVGRPVTVFGTAVEVVARALRCVAPSSAVSLEGPTPDGVWVVCVAVGGVTLAIADIAPTRVVGTA